MKVAGGHDHAIRSVNLFAGWSGPCACRSANAECQHERPEEIQVQKHTSPEDKRDRLTNVQLQKDAKELAELCASVAGDMDGVKQGLLLKDVLDKLNRVEKLSKHVREQLMRASGPN
jgi:hypothetical protein